MIDYEGLGSRESVRLLGSLKFKNKDNGNVWDYIDIY